MFLSRGWRRLRAAAAVVLAVVMASAPAGPVWAHRDPPGRELHVDVEIEYADLTKDQDDGLDGDAELRLMTLVNHLPDHGATFTVFPTDFYDWDSGKYVGGTYQLGPDGTYVSLELKWQPNSWIIFAEAYAHDECTPRNEVQAELTLVEIDVDGITVFLTAATGAVIGVIGGVLGGPVVGAALAAGTVAVIQHSQANDDLGSTKVTVPAGYTTAFLRGPDGGADVEIHSRETRGGNCTPAGGLTGLPGTGTLSPAQATAAVFDPLEEALASIDGIRAEAGNPGNLSEADLLGIQATARGITLGLGAISTGLALNTAYGLAGYDEAAQTLAEGLLAAREDPAAALAVFRDAHQQALTAAAENAPAGAPPRSPLQLLPLSDYLSVRQGGQIPLPLVITGTEGGVSVTASGLPPGARSRVEPLTDDGLVQQLTLDLREAVPGSYRMTVTAAGAGGARATRDIALRIVPASAAPANREPTVRSAPGTLHLTAGEPAAVIDLAGLFVDPDGDPLTISARAASSAVAALGWDDDTQTLSVIPLGEGMTDIALTAADDDGESAGVMVPVVVAAAGSEGITLDADDIRSKLDAEGNVVLQFETPEAVVQLTREAVQALRDSGAPLQINSVLGGVEIPAEALAGLPAEGAIRFALRPVSATVWPGVAQALAAASAEPVLPGGGIVFEAAMADPTAVPLSFPSPVTVRIDLEAQPAPALGTAAAVIDGVLRPVPTRFGGGAVLFEARRPGVFTVARRNVAFTDTANHWARDSVALLAGKLIVGGVGEGRFEPDRPVTRAEVAAIVARGLGLGLQATGAFTDVPTGVWYNGEVGAAVAAGLVNGYGDGTFQPGRDMTRAEAAAVLVRALEAATGQALVQGADGQALTAYSDYGAIPGWALPYLDAAVRAGLLSGYPDRTLRPGGRITRAELVVMVTRMLEAARLIQTGP